MYSEYFTEEDEQMKLLAISTLVLLTGIAVAQDFPSVPEPEGDLQYLVLLLLLFFGWLAHLGTKLWTSSKEAAKDDEDQQEAHIIARIQIMEVKFEGMITDIRSTLVGEHKLLKQEVSQLQRELSDFKKEVRARNESQIG